MMVIWFAVFVVGCEHLKYENKVTELKRSWVLSKRWGQALGGSGICILRYIPIYFIYLFLHVMYINICVCVYICLYFYIHKNNQFDGEISHQKGIVSPN